MVIETEKKNLNYIDDLFIFIQKLNFFGNEKYQTLFFFFLLFNSHLKSFHFYNLSEFCEL